MNYFHWGPGCAELQAELQTTKVMKFSHRLQWNCVQSNKIQLYFHWKEDEGVGFRKFCLLPFKPIHIDRKKVRALEHFSAAHCNLFPLSRQTMTLLVESARCNPLNTGVDMTSKVSARQY
jgi:hypothetical protein